MHNSSIINNKAVADCRNKPVSIGVNKLVKDYTLERLNALGGLCYSEVHQSIKSGKGIVTKDDRKAMMLFGQIIENIPGFIPLYPRTSADDTRMHRFVDSWLSHVKQLYDKFKEKNQPVYLHAKVNEELQRLGSSVKCEDIHLEWYLSRYGSEAMQPDKIAAAIIEHDATDWKKVKPLVKNTKYSIRLKADSEKERKAVLRNIQWLHSVQRDVATAELFTMLKNDLQVLKEFEKWRNGEPEDYEYSQRYEEFRQRLQTAPLSQPSGVPAETGRQISTAAAPVRLEAAPSSGGANIGSNFDRVMAVLNEKAQNDSFGQGTLKETYNLSCIRSFAGRPDFQTVFNTLVSHRSDCRMVTDMMRYIRNVVLRNHTAWGVGGSAGTPQHPDLKS